MRLRWLPHASPWHRIARPEQLAPDGEWRVWLLCTGRGWGKNRTQGEWVQDKVALLPGEVGFISGRTLGEVIRNAVNHPRSGLLATSRPGNPAELRLSKGGAGGHEVRWRNGARAEIHTSEEPDRARGMEYAWGLADEIATWKRVVDFEGNSTWENLYLGLRAPVGNPQVVAGTTPRRRSKLLRNLIERAEDPTDCVVLTRGRTQDNADNLSGAYLVDVMRTYAGTHLERQELDGELLPDVDGALVTSDMIESNRVEEVPCDLQRIVVGVDPSGGGDAQGIVAVGLGSDGHGYVIADRTCRLLPAGWGQRAVDLYHTHQAHRLVAERNYGGDMVESTIRTIDPLVSYKAVTASRGKAVRFEPVGSLYEQGRLHHVGTFNELEDEVCCFTTDSYEGEGSPNRADALVWAVHDLMLRQAQLSPEDVMAMMEGTKSNGNGSAHVAA
ncbi:MAG TPA: ATP-binding protein [Phycisphaerae bacterium]|nr:ATP-binding protein [Phycisphaerae bacterium]